MHLAVNLVCGSMIFVCLHQHCRSLVVEDHERLTRGEEERGHSISKRSSDETDLVTLLNSLQHELHAEENGAGQSMHEEEERSYNKRDDIYVDKRWRDVYSEPDSSGYERHGRAVMNSISEEQKRIITDLHNNLRRQEGASNMEILRYNPKLAELGQKWSTRCRFEHGQPSFSEQDVGHKDLGQNIFAHESKAFKVEDAVQAWYDEKSDYEYNSLTCHPGKVCGHYTAVTWAKTTDVGCGMTFCPSISGLRNAHFIVCNYAPPGNFGGEKPFLKGAACTQCDSGKFFCNKKLCDVSCKSEGQNCKCSASCKNCAKKNSNTCTCSCTPGHTGPDCSENCEDKDRSCGANPGLPPFLCTMNDPTWEFVKDKCPKMCKKCEPSDGKPCKQKQGRSALKRAMLGYLENELDNEEK